jgi:hypothetical protein
MEKLKIERRGAKMNLAKQIMKVNTSEIIGGQGNDNLAAINDNVVLRN